jgi:hypothetical protein
MARPLSPATPNDVANVQRALQLLRQARDCLADTGSPNALARVNLAISSTDGAVRHVQRRANANRHDRSARHAESEEIPA